MIFNPFKSKPKVTAEDIHREFLSASEVLLKEANEIINESLMNKSDRLEKAGFGQAVEVKRAEESRKFKKYVQTVQHRGMTHPNNKVITNEQVTAICQKYNLILGEIKRYKGFVPDKNLKEVEAFKKKENKNFCVVRFDSFSQIQRVVSTHATFKEAQEAARNLTGVITRHYALNYEPFMICAPLKDMELKRGERIKNHRIEIPDPVVLYPIENDCFLIVTAWGDEASDPIVFNEKMN